MTSLNGVECSVCHTARLRGSGRVFVGRRERVRVRERERERESPHARGGERARERASGFQTWPARPSRNTRSSKTSAEMTGRMLTEFQPAAGKQTMEIL